MKQTVKNPIDECYETSKFKSKIQICFNFYKLINSLLLQNKTNVLYFKYMIWECQGKRYDCVSDIYAF